jgi:anti-sigma factor RsiW
MKRRHPEHSTLREWLSLELDGELSAGEKSRLDQHLALCPECRNERRELSALERLMADSRIEVREGFRQEVMSDLPTAGWEARPPRTWIAALVAVLALAVASAALIATSSGDLTAAVPVAALVAVWELFRSSALAGAGLLAASWKGLGIAVQEVLGHSIWSTLAFGAVVLGLDVLLLRYLLRRRRAAVEEGRSRSSSSRP